MDREEIAEGIYGEGQWERAGLRGQLYRSYRLYTTAGTFIGTIFEDARFGGWHAWVGPFADPKRHESKRAAAFAAVLQAAKEKA